MKFSIKDFFSKCDQFRRKLRIWSHFVKKSLMENFIFCAESQDCINLSVLVTSYIKYKMLDDFMTETKIVIPICEF